MAQIEITFAEYTRPLSYDDYTNNQAAICNDDAQPRNILFNTNGDFCLGYNYLGDSADTVTIVSFTDTMEEFEVGVGSLGTPSGFVPSTIQDSYNNNLTYPYTLQVEDLFKLKFQANTVEMLCDGSNKFYTERSRVIEYYITDINSNIGAIKKSTLFQTTQ